MTKENQQPAEDAPEYALEAFLEIKQKLEPDGHKFILLIFDKDDFLTANGEKGRYSIHVLASVGGQIVSKVLDDLTTKHIEL